VLINDKIPNTVDRRVTTSLLFIKGKNSSMAGRCDTTLPVLMEGGVPNIVDRRGTTLPVLINGVNKQNIKNQITHT